jgi:hypothetical protein
MSSGMNAYIAGRQGEVPRKDSFEWSFGG